MFYCILFLFVSDGSHNNTQSVIKVIKGSILSDHADSNTARFPEYLTKFSCCQLDTVSGFP